MRKTLGRDAMWRACRRGLGLLLLAAGWAACAVAATPEPGHWRERFMQEVDRQLEVPVPDQARYLAALEVALTEAGLSQLPPQALLLVDRSVHVQAAFLVLRTAESGWHWLGAVPISTGKAGTFDHFVTPLGVFAHTLDNPDFRAEGTVNVNGIRGYGVRGMRVYDFGWTSAERGWGRGGRSPMRLQIHATDPIRLEPGLGQAASKGCIRIPASFNVFMDRHGVLDADYVAAWAEGRSLWVLRSDWAPMPWPGRYLVVVDTRATARPDWSPRPGAAKPSPRNKSP